MVWQNPSRGTLYITYAYQDVFEDYIHFITQMGPSSCPILQKYVRPFLVYNIRIGPWDLTNFILYKLPLYLHIYIHLYNIALINSKKRYHVSKYRVWIDCTNWIEHKITNKNARGPLACIWHPLKESLSLTIGLLTIDNFMIYEDSRYQLQGHKYCNHVVELN